MAASAPAFAAPPRWSRTLAQTTFACAASLLLHVLALGGLAWWYQRSAATAVPAFDLRIASVYLAPAASVPSPAAPSNAPLEPVTDTLPVPDLRAPVEDLATLAPMPMAQAVIAPESSPAALAPQTDASTSSNTEAREPRAEPGAAVEWRVQDWLAQHRSYPRAARRSGAEGTVWVRFVLDRRGALHGSEILESSGHAVLDRAALDLLQRAAPFPALPATLTLDEIELVLPIEYDLTRARRG